MAQEPQPDQEAGKSFRTFIAPFAQLVTVIVFAGTVFAWGFRLQDKVDRLESQLQALAVAPVISQPNPKAAEARQPARLEGPNPLLQTCADVASRIATAHEKSGASGSVSLSMAISALEGLFKTLGCEGLAKSR
jgi:hypothetical protein